MLLSEYHPRRKRPVQGFTLTELLIVITIIAVLIGLLMTVYPRVLESGRNATCTSNLRNIGVGLSNYINENEGKLIPGAVILSGYFWFDELTPYMGHSKIIRLPSGKVQWENGDEIENYPLKWLICPSKEVLPINRQSIGYGWNYANFGYTWQQPNSYGWGSRMTQVTQPSKTIIIGDSLDNEDNGNPPTASKQRYLRPDNAGYPPAKRHSGHGNYLFLDGHVEAFLATNVKENQLHLFKKN